MVSAKPRSDLAYLCRALKAPTLAASVERLGDRARALLGLVVRHVVASRRESRSNE